MAAAVEANFEARLRFNQPPGWIAAETGKAPRQNQQKLGVFSSKLNRISKVAACPPKAALIRLLTA